MGNCEFQEALLGLIRLQEVLSEFIRLQELQESSKDLERVEKT